MPNKQRDDGRVWFDTNADRLAFFKALTRSTFPISNEVDDLELCEDPNKNCEYGSACRNPEENNYSYNKADFIIVKGYGKDRNRHPICMKCLEQEVETWFNDQIQTIKDHLERYQMAEEL